MDTSVDGFAIFIRRRNSTYFFEINLELNGLTDVELQLVNSFKKYFTKTWINGSENLSVFYNEVTTNNGAESYHNTLRSYLKSIHPNIWKFMSSMDKVMCDYDLELKLDDGLQITRMPKLKSRSNVDFRMQYKLNT